MAHPTPMITQYNEIKSRYMDAILFFRLGDFYEMFYDDALLASKELEITLTGRGQNENRMPMCGIPHHAASNYIGKLIEKGYKVAICEQTEDPKQTKGIVKREVVRMITPGTLIENDLLKGRVNNYLVSINFTKKSIGLAYLDYSTGEFKIASINNLDQLKDEILRLAPAECLLPDILPEYAQSIRQFIKSNNITISDYKDIYDADEAEENLKKYFKINSLSAFGLNGMENILGAAISIIFYIKSTQKVLSAHINKLQPYYLDNYMFIDAATAKNLEIVKTARDGSFKGSLMWIIDQTVTNMGSRLLKRWLMQPLLDIDALNQKYDAIEELINLSKTRIELDELLAKTYDMERLTSRVASGSANAKDLLALKETLKNLPNITILLKTTKSNQLKKIAQINKLENLVELIEKAVVDDPPFTITEGGIIKSEYNQELKELKELASGGKKWVAELEKNERVRTGIKSLKVGYTKVFGYYIEINKSNLHSAPVNYIRKQTLVNAERYITPELKEKESLILNIDQKIKELEYKIFNDVRKEVAGYTVELQQASFQLAALDCFLSLAKVALSLKLVRPELAKNNNINIKNSRHLVVEQTIGQHRFVPNQVLMNNDCRFLLITGPNMAGKSTYMKQIALTSILAQIGSFVPADKAELTIVDRIFTRIGAMDDIFSGQSTFMLEMTETANILNNATKDSLIILDEIGRGTATFDGMSIAAAVAEYIHTKIKAKTLFATHYHEITQLAEKHKGMQNLSVAVSEKGDHITFLYLIKNQAADRSYGIQVAKLAGLPKEVVERSKEIYGKLEMVENDLGKETSQKQLKGNRKQLVKNQMGLF